MERKTVIATLALALALVAAGSPASAQDPADCEKKFTAPPSEGGGRITPDVLRLFGEGAECESNGGHWCPPSAYTCEIFARIYVYAGEPGKEDGGSVSGRLFLRTYRYEEPGDPDWEWNKEGSVSVSRYDFPVTCSKRADGCAGGIRVTVPGRTAVRMTCTSRRFATASNFVFCYQDIKVDSTVHGVRERW